MVQICFRLLKTSHQKVRTLISQGFFMPELSIAQLVGIYISLLSFVFCRLCFVFCICRPVSPEAWDSVERAH